MVSLDQPLYAFETPIFVSAEAPNGFTPPKALIQHTDPFDPTGIVPRVYFTYLEERSRRRQLYNPREDDLE